MEKPLAFLADEGVEKQIVLALRKQYDVMSVAETMASAKDDTVLAAANRLDRILITLDKDFGELVFREHYANAGVILCRLQSLPISEAVRLVSDTVSKYGQELWSAFTVIQPRNTRIRKM